ncbi:MAG: TadE/TadG family type IV pilus assembly protein [Pseudomonadota bacterium]
MSKSPKKPTHVSIKRFVGRFLNAKTGVVAIEFAYLAPILMIMIGGTIEASRAISMSRKFSQVTSMTGDLVARERDLGTNPTQTLDQMMNVVDHVMSPYDGASLKMAIIPVMASPTDETDTFVYAPPYSHNNKSAPAKCAPYQLPTGLIGRGGSVIIVESEFQYVPLFAGMSFYSGSTMYNGGHDDGFVAGATWTDKSTHAPRHACVDFEDNNCVVTCS